MKFIDPANLCCGSYEGGEPPYLLVARTVSRYTYYRQVKS